MQSKFSFNKKQITIDTFAPSGAGRHPIVCALHGAGGLYSSEHLQFAQLLANQGFFVCVPHYFEVTGTSWADDATIWREFRTWMAAISAALNHVAQNLAADGERIGLVGFSLGAYLSLALGADDPRVKAIVDFFGGIPQEIADNFKKIAPVLILHGDADYRVPVAEAHRLAQLLDARNSPYEMKIYEGAGHGFRGFDMMDAGMRTYDFLNKHLREPKQSVA